MVSTPCDHAVVTAKSKAFAQRIEKRLGHGPVVDKAHGIRLATLLQTRRHLLNQALVNRRIQLQFRIPRELKAVGLHRADVEYAPKDLGQTGADHIIEGDVDRTFAAPFLPRDFNEPPQLLRGHFQHREAFLIRALNHDSQIEGLIRQIRYRQRLIEHDGLQLGQYRLPEVPLNKLQLTLV